MVVAQGAWPLFWEQAQAIAAYFQAEERKSPRVEQFNALRSATPPDYKGPIFKYADELHVEAKRDTALLRNFVRWIQKTDVADLTFPSGRDGN